MSFLKEFKEFAVSGNVVELAVAVIIGKAFGDIVNSFVADVITPLLLNPVLEKTGVANIKELAWNGVTYGNFLAAVINFICIAFVLFMMVKAINKVKKPADVAVAEPTAQETLLMEIRDELRRKG